MAISAPEPQKAQTTLSDLFGDVIVAYTRAQAIEDGQQTLLTGELADTAREAGYRYPVYLTSTVFDVLERAEKNKKWCNDWKGLIWDLCWMSARTGRMIDEQTRQFVVTIKGAGRRSNYTFYAQCGPTDIDNAAPCITIMTREEM
jgi:hypothetical protein